jgi:hypothetical protein
VVVYVFDDVVVSDGVSHAHERPHRRYVRSGL